MPYDGRVVIGPYGICTIDERLERTWDTSVLKVSRSYFVLDTETVEESWLLYP